MQLQKTFTNQYLTTLVEEAKSGLSLHKYAKESFDYDESQVRRIPHVIHPEHLKNKMFPNPQSDFQSAIALYEAYPVSPLQASDRAFWAYLTHVDLFEYVQQRFPEVLRENFINTNYIGNHWLFLKGIFRNALSGLWWRVYFSVDDESTEKYRYTQFLFDHDFDRFTESLLIRHKEAVYGILGYLMEDTEISGNFMKQRGHYIIKHFNKIGGVKLLSVLDRNFFYNELKRIRPILLKIK
ncbi:MAG: hypothetical protein K2I89_05505 [Muribaculaceae bacterium]|nr:hypothetical protein [Muribaculaceae bacterium]